MAQQKGSEVFFQTLGGAGFLFGLYSGYWWLCQRMTWWTFGLCGSVACFLYVLGKAFIKELRRK